MSDYAAQRGKQTEGEVIHISNGFFALDGTKSRDLKIPRVDVNRRYTVGGKSSCTAEGLHPKSFSLQLGETPKVGRKKYEVGEGSSIRKNAELFNDEATISGKGSAGQHTECAIEWKNSKSYSCHCPDVSWSEFEHFPMFDINRKIDAILTSNKKHAHGAISAKMKKESLFLHEKVMIPYESLLANNTDEIGGASSRFFQTNDKLLKTGKRSNTDSNSRYSGSSWSSVKEGSTNMLRESSPSYCPYPFSSDRYHAEEKDESFNRIILCQKRLKSNGSPLHSAHDMNIHKTCQKFKPAESGERFRMCLRKPTMGDYVFTAVNKPAISDRRIILFGQKYDKEEISTVPFGNVACEEVRNYEDGTSDYHMGASNESFTRTDTINSHPQYRSSCLYGNTFISAQKGVASSDSTAEQAARNTLETTSANRRPAPTFSSQNMAGSSRTETMALDNNISIAMLADNTSGSEMSSRWVKRLQDNHSETLSICSKRPKEGGASSTECYNLTPISSFKTAMPCSGYSEKSVQSWIGRWSHNCSETSPAVSRPGEPVAFQQESSKEVPEKFKGKMLGSIGAMALMGKTLSAYRPCTFRRKQASLVWNT